MAEYHFNEARFHDPEAARQHLESVRWPYGPVCPHCGSMERMSKLQGKSHRPGLYECGHCRDQFTVTVGTVFERSKISLDKWLLASALIASSKKGISAKQVERMLGVTYKTAWFMMHRLREAMKRVDPQPYLGGGNDGGSGVVEADETYVGVRPGRERKRGFHHKNPVVSLVERGGKVRSFAMASVTGATLKPLMQEHVSPKANLVTDEASVYTGIVGRWFATHSTVAHGAKEYVRGSVHTNTVEGFFSILKRGKPPAATSLDVVKAKYVQMLVDALEEKLKKGDVDEALMGKIEKLLGIAT